MQQQQKQQQHPLQQQPWQQRRKQRQGRSTVSSATRAVDGQEQPQDPHDGIESSHLADALARVLEGLTWRDSFIFSGGQIRTVRITWCGSCTQSDALGSARQSRQAAAEEVNYALCLFMGRLANGPRCGRRWRHRLGHRPRPPCNCFLSRLTTHEPPTNFVVLEYIRVLRCPYLGGSDPANCHLGIPPRKPNGHLLQRPFGGHRQSGSGFL